MNRGHEVGCPALRGGVPCACWVVGRIELPPQPAKIVPPALSGNVYLLGKPVRYWLEIDHELKKRGYDRLLDGFIERTMKAERGVAVLEAQIRTVRDEIRALDIEWHGLQGLCSDQRKGIIELSEAIDLTGRASPWD